VPHPPEWYPNLQHIVEGYRAEEICGLVEAAGWRIVRVECCMLIITLLFAALQPKVRIPFPFNHLVALENLVRECWRMKLLWSSRSFRGEAPCPEPSC
jgi:hypothetical protein